MRVRLEQTDSTQRVARELAEQGVPDGTVVIADAQTAGRGTHGRSWSSPPGQNLYATAILRPSVPLAQAALLSLRFVALLAQRLNGLLPDAPVRVKWPNDLVTIEGKKVAGILGEMESRDNHIRYVLLGVGLNVNQLSFPTELPNATSLALLGGGPLEREGVLETLCAALAEGPLLPHGLDLWRSLSHTLGRQVRVGEVEGLAEGLAPDGALIVGGRRVYSGELWE